MKQTSFKIGVDVKTSGLDFDLANRLVTINCPECKAENTVSLDQIQREENITCTGCGKTIKLVDQNKSVAKAILNINQSIDELRRSLESLKR